MVFPEKARKPCTSVVWVHYSTRKPHENKNFASFDSSHLPFRAKCYIDPESSVNVSNHVLKLNGDLDPGLSQGW